MYQKLLINGEIFQWAKFPLFRFVPLLLFFPMVLHIVLLDVKHGSRLVFVQWIIFVEIIVELYKEIFFKYF